MNTAMRCEIPGRALSGGWLWFFLGTLALACNGLLAQDPLDEVEDAYKLRTGDVVRINVFNEPDLAVEQKLDPDGVIIIPLLGRTSLEGLTMRESEARLEALFRSEEFLIQPQVTVSVTQYAQTVFYIFGEVRSPGAKEFPQGRQSVDILEAITMAGDLSQYAKRSEIILRRPIPGTKNEEKIMIDLDSMVRGGTRNRNTLVEVLPNDIIFVPQRMF
jgi:polysaccharide export outer membrane protein